MRREFLLHGNNRVKLCRNIRKSHQYCSRRAELCCRESAKFHENLGNYTKQSKKPGGRGEGKDRERWRGEAAEAREGEAYD